MIAASGWVSKSCKINLGKSVDRATSYKHGNGRHYQTFLPINVWSRLRYDQWCLGSLQQMHVHPLMTKRIAGLISCCVSCLLSFSGRLQWYHPCLSQRLFMLVPQLTYIRQPLLQFLCPKIICGWFCRRSTWLLAASSNSNLGNVYIGFLKVCRLLWYKN